MSDQAASIQVIEPVRYAVTVPLTADRAFALFTEGFNSWWPGHHIGTAEMAEAVLEPRAGGRYYERGVDGSECDWGKVLACDPPHRIVVAWQITAKGDAWVYDPDLSHASEFEVTFREQPDGQTRVELEHRNIDRHGLGAAGIYQGVAGPGGWPGILDNYAKVATSWFAGLQPGVCRTRSWPGWDRVRTGLRGRRGSLPGSGPRWSRVAARPPPGRRARRKAVRYRPERIAITTRLRARTLSRPAMRFLPLMWPR